MGKHTRTLVAALLIAGATLCSAQASEIVIGTGEFPPYTTDKTAGQGCVIRIVRSAYEAEGWTVKLQFLSWPRNLALLSRGEIDASAYWAARPDRREEYIFPKDPVTSEIYKFIFPKDKIIQWNTYADFRRKSIVINSDYTYNEEFYKAFEKFDIKKEEVASISQNLPMILKGRADLTIMEEKVFEKYMSELSDEQQSQLYDDPKPALTFLAYLIFSRSDSEKSRRLAEIFDRGYEKIRGREDLQDAFETCGF